MFNSIDQYSSMMHSVLIIGANRGIGLEFVEQLVAKKNPKYVFASCRDPEKAEALHQLAAEHPTIKLIRLDVTDDASIDSAAAEVASVVGREGLGVLINNAAIYYTAPLQDLTREKLQESFDVNTTGPFIIIQKFLPLLRKSSALTSSPVLSCENAIINLTSRFGSISNNTSGSSGRGAYAYRVSKAALNMMTKSLSIDLRQDNILAVALQPAWVPTEMGGPDATGSVEDSVADMIEVMDRLGERENGRMVKYDGTIVPF